MKRPPHVVSRILLWMIAVYHFIAGIAAVFFQEAAAPIADLFFGVSITLTPQTELLVRYLGAFGLSFGVLATLAALAPEKNRAIIYGFVVYFVVRAFTRVVFWRLLEEHAVGPVPNWLRIIVILLMAATLLVSAPRAETA